MAINASTLSAFHKSRLYTERRLGRRYPTNICVVFPKDGDIHFCRIAEVSANGAFLETDQPFERGEKISFSIAKNSLGVPLEGVVTRRLTARQSHTGRAGVGLHFIHQGNDYPATRDDLVLYLLNYPHHTIWERYTS